MGPTWLERQGIQRLIVLLAFVEAHPSLSSACLATWVARGEASMVETLSDPLAGVRNARDLPTSAQALL